METAPAGTHQGFVHRVGTLGYADARIGLQSPDASACSSRECDSVFVGAAIGQLHDAQAIAGRDGERAHQIMYRHLSDVQAHIAEKMFPSASAAL